MGLVTILHFNNLVVDLAFLAHFDNLFLRGIWVTVLQIEHDAVVKQGAVLWDDRDVLAEAVESLLGQVLSIDEHTATLWVVDPEQ